MNQSTTTTATAPAITSLTGPRRHNGATAFLREATRSMYTTGAVAPSGSPLARRLAEPLPAPSGRSPLRVLEVGAGTGTVTRALAERLGPGDRLDTVELNPRFVQMLTEALRTDPALAAASERIRIIPKSICHTPLPVNSYDVIVSCLPFMNFAPDMVRSLMERYMAALVPGGHLTFFGYLGTLSLRTLFAQRTEAARYRAVAAVLAEFSARYGDRDGGSVEWRNLPPARVSHLRAPQRRVDVTDPDSFGQR
ncbi:MULTISPECIES: class I SAM-dependent methyltransferase [unclassified Streptomyces]|uniref:class I SAM-dependent methyltransferase n=1 Tax=unclassified Streptomyces TaxID=2593676 RepID=UPI0005633D71|nr:MULTISPECIES: class I SAM-dependent methyltransferase [unclassified Streptomyces]MYT30904.1 methyltransferase domain-containing protein [Streptomyces sp. SID8354]